MVAIKYRSSAATHVGLVRKNNEDSFLTDDANGIFIVADGMGGEAAGEVASSMAVEIIASHLTKVYSSNLGFWPIVYHPKLSFAHNSLKAGFLSSNAAIYSRAKSEKDKQGMGTTGCALLVRGDHLSFGHVGDSRAYILRDEVLMQITTDHTWVNEQFEMGLISKEEMDVHPYRNIITRALGAHQNVEVDHIDLTVKDGDKIMLCSDGLNGMASDEEIQAIMIADESIDKIVEMLIDQALVGSGGDNVTIVALEFFDS